MKGHLYAKFMERRGRGILEGLGCYWYDVGMRMIMSIPYHEEMDPPTQEIQELLRRNGRIGARYLTHAGSGLAGGLYIRRKSPYTLASIAHDARNHVRRSIDKYAVREVAKDEFLRQGLQLNLDTMGRQGRFDREFGEERSWRQFVEAAYSSPGVRVTGTFVEGALAAYIVSVTEDRWIHLLHQFSATRWLSTCFPNDALTFVLTKAAMEDPGIDAISYGLAGLVEPPKLSHYKLHHGYEFVPFGYGFVFHPALQGLLANPVSAWGLHTAQRLCPKAQVFERIASVVDGARMTHSTNRIPSPSEAAQEVHHA